MVHPEHPTVSEADMDRSSTVSESIFSSEGDNDDPNEVVTWAPKERFRLGYLDVMCLVINRMIGTGIFNTPQRVMQGTRSTGTTLLFWFAGIVYCLCGTHVYIEYGLNVPRYTINGVEQSVPRSGGDLNYLQYVYRRPRYRKNTILFVTCLFGIAFISLGNMAGNSISFALRVLQAAGVQNPENGAVRGIAIGVATFACFIHTFSRRGGIWLNNILAAIKLCMLLLIIVTAIIVGAGGLPNTKNQIGANTTPSSAFGDASQDSNGYALAFLSIIFAFGGFEQPNYVLGEISQPRRKFPISMIAGVSIVVTLYMAVNISYMVVVPADRQIRENVAQVFFELTLGSGLGSVAGSQTGTRIFNAFLAVSSFGNIVVMTYTAARVKQEIAKEGILPFPKFFAQNKDLSLGRVLKWLRRVTAGGDSKAPGGGVGIIRRILAWRWLAPEQHSEKTPVGALLLHFCSCLVLLFATYGMAPTAAYDLLTGMSAYSINAFFGTLLGLGILILRFRGATATDDEEDENDLLDEDLDGGDNMGFDARGFPIPPMPKGPHISAREKGPAQKPPRMSWATLTGRGFSPALSVVAATIYMVGNMYPLIASWVPPKTGTTVSSTSTSTAPSNATTSAIPNSGSSISGASSLVWWNVPAISLCILAAGALWFLGWIGVAKREEKVHNRIFVVRKRPEFESADGAGHGHDGGEVGHGGAGGGNDNGGGSGGLVLVHETVFLSWVGKETLGQNHHAGAASGMDPGPGGPRGATDGEMRHRSAVMSTAFSTTSGVPSPMMASPLVGSDDPRRQSDMLAMQQHHQMQMQMQLQAQQMGLAGQMGMPPAQMGMPGQMGIPGQVPVPGGLMQGQMMPGMPSQAHFATPGMVGAGQMPFGAGQDFGPGAPAAGFYPGGIDNRRSYH